MRKFWGQSPSRHRVAIPAGRYGALVKTFLTLAVVGIIGSSVLAVSTSIPNSDLGGGDEPILLVQDTPSPPPRLALGTVSGVTNTSWTTVNLPYDYESMVVIATPNYDDSAPPLVTRIRNASGTSFDVRVDRVDGSVAAVSGVPVYYLVVERGVYSTAQDGVKMEAVRFTSVFTDRSDSWLGQPRSFSNSYTLPVVLGQVMSYNDPDFSVFWSRGPTAGDPVSSSTFYAGKHVGEDSDTTRSFETIGYVVFESGWGTVEGHDYFASTGGDIVRGVDNSPPYDYAISGLSSVTAAVASSAGMNGNDGGWPILYGSPAITSTNMQLAIEEDQLSDAERSHPTEQVAVAMFE